MTYFYHYEAEVSDFDELRVYYWYEAYNGGLASFWVVPGTFDNR